MAQVHLLPVVHGLADGVAFAGNTLGVLEGRQEFGEAIGPATLEVDVLGVRDQERGVEVRQAQRDNESSVADGPAHGMGDLNLVSDALLLDAMFRADKQDLACSVAECVLQQTLPVLPAAQSEHIRPDFVTGGGESRAEPDGEGVVLRVGVTDEDCVAGALGHMASPQLPSDRGSSRLPETMPDVHHRLVDGQCPGAVANAHIETRLVLVLDVDRVVGRLRGHLTDVLAVNLVEVDRQE